MSVPGLKGVLDRLSRVHDLRGGRDVSRLAVRDHDGVGGGEKGSWSRSGESSARKSQASQSGRERET